MEFDSNGNRIIHLFPPEFKLKHFSLCLFVGVSIVAIIENRNWNVIFMFVIFISNFDEVFCCCCVEPLISKGILLTVNLLHAEIGTNFEFGYNSTTCWN